MTETLFLAALACWAFGASVDLVAGARRAWSRGLPYLAALVGSGLVAAAGMRAVLGATTVVPLGASLGVGASSLRLDALAGMFLTVTGGLGAAVSACVYSWGRARDRGGDGARIRRRGYAAGYLLLLGAVTVIITAGDAFSFLFAWESLTVAFYILVGVRARTASDARPAWVTFVLGKLGGAALLVGFLLLAGRAGTDVLSAWSRVGPGPLHAVAYTLIIVGFAAKVGLLPLQVWLPLGYPAAPGPIRAALAGLAANVGFYGMWRFLAILGRPPIWLVVVVLVVGGLSALVGIVFAAVQARLDRVIAYSSVENAGVITVGYGVALAGAATSQTELVAVGLLAASLQVLAHAVGKSSLFAAGAFFTEDWGSDSLEELRGVGHTHRWSGTVFSIGSITLAGLPPTIGFVSEWFILEALLQEFRIHMLELRLAMAVAGALVALTVGVAAFTFVRLVGLTVLSRSAPPPLATAGRCDGGGLGRAGLIALAAWCLGLAAIAPWVIRFLAAGLAPVVPAARVRGALRSPWVLQPVYANFSILSPSWLWVVLPLAFLAVVLLAMVLSGGRFLRVRRVPAWRSATEGVPGADRYSSFGYANVVRHVLGNVLGSRREVITLQEPDAEGDPGEPAQVARVEVRSRVIEPVETYLYRPAWRAFLAVSALSRRLQSGQLSAYVAYMLVALLVVLVVVAVV